MLEKELVLERNFFPVQGLDHFRRTKKDERAIAPGPRTGAELGFAYQKNDLTVVVWTSYVPGTARARQQDSGWLVIEEWGQARYYVRLNRTRNFVPNILMEAKIARLRIRLRPSCEHCQKAMVIAWGKGRGARYWRCALCYARAPWDTPKFLEALPPEARRYLDRRRRARERWYRICRKNGKPIREAMMRRKKWGRVKLQVRGF